MFGGGGVDVDVGEGVAGVGVGLRARKGPALDNREKERMSLKTWRRTCKMPLATD